MTRAYIISPTEDRADTLGLMPGEHWFEARQIKNGPLVAIHTAVIVPMEDGQIVGDVKYLVEINGRELPFDEWEHMTLIGEEITREAYNYRLAAFAWDKDNLGLHERAVVDVTKLPPVMPPMRPAADREAAIPEGPMREMWHRAKACGITIDHFEKIAVDVFNRGFDDPDIFIEDATDNIEIKVEE